ncbi:MAG: putative baseplate assembly protein [Solirubrobacteraceae bacterium]
MTLPPVKLDDRTFQDLVSEARLRITQTCPEWTEHNVSDPGITLIELFAWMTDLLIYRVNRLPEKIHVALLDLLGIQLAPPAAAQVLVRFRLAGRLEDPVHIAARTTEVATTRGPNGDPIVFEVRDEFTIRPARPAAYVIEREGSLSEVGVADGEARPHEGDCRPFATPPRPGDALYLGFADPLGRLLLGVDVVALQARGAGVDPADPPLRWEVAQGDGAWAPAEVLTDTTGGFNFGSGTIELAMPRRSMVVPIAGRRLYWLRCRLLDRAGTGPSGGVTYSHPPEIRQISAGAIGAQLPVRHAVVETHEGLGYSDGTPAQTLRLLNRPALPLEDGETLEVLDPDAEEWQRWDEAESFAASSATDRHFVFDETAGEILLGPAIRHGDGGWTQHGAVPPTGSAFRMSAYRHGGGRHGNVAAGEITVLRSAIPGIASVTNPLPARGGVDAEDLDSARRRATLELRTRHRAVTADDFVHLAMEATNGVDRARCAEIGPGAVAVYLVAAIDDADRPLTLAELTPGRNIVLEVAEYLDARRIVGTTVSVGAAPMRGVSIVVNVEAAPHSDLGRVEIDVRRALYRYLNPLIGGGSGRLAGGWRFGRPVTQGELHGVIQVVPGVELISLLRIYESDLRTGQRSARPVGDRLEIGPDELIVSDNHTVKATRRQGT